MKYEDELIDESVKRKLKILSFFEKHGLAPTVDAYNISRSTIYRWKKLLKDNNGKIEVLKDRSKMPKNKRKRETDLRIIDYIVMIRKKYPRMGNFSFYFSLTYFLFFL